MPGSPKETKDSSSIFICTVQVSSAQSMKISVFLFPDEQTVEGRLYYAVVMYYIQLTC